MSGDQERGLEARLAKWAEGAACHLCVLFGSRAGAGPVVKGDLDIALQFEEIPGPERRLEIIGELQDICGSADVDVVFLHAGTDPVVRFEIFRGGTSIYEAEPRAFIDEQVRALMLYEDALPFRRRLREALRRDGQARPHVS